MPSIKGNITDIQSVKRPINNEPVSLFGTECQIFDFEEGKNAVFRWKLNKCIEAAVSIKRSEAAYMPSRAEAYDQYLESRQAYEEFRLEKANQVNQQMVSKFKLGALLGFFVGAAITGFSIFCYFFFG